MPNRREFFKEVAGVTAGIVFSGCSLVRAAPQSAPAGKRRLVTVGGKRVKTIDVHAHCNVPEAMALMPNPPNGQNLFLTPERVADRLALMDQQGTDIEALSINPFWYGVDRDLARRIPARPPVNRFATSRAVRLASAAWFAPCPRCAAIVPRRRNRTAADWARRW